MAELEKELSGKPVGLAQNLKEGERGVALYHNSRFVGYEDIYTPTQEQLDAELETEARELAIAEITAKKKAEFRR